MTLPHAPADRLQWIADVYEGVEDETVFHFRQVDHPLWVGIISVQFRCNLGLIFSHFCPKTPDRARMATQAVYREGAPEI